MRIIVPVYVNGAHQYYFFWWVINKVHRILPELFVLVVGVRDSGVGEHAG